MNTVFVDTAAWIALLNTADALHASAQHVMHTLRDQNAPLVTTEFVLLELADALATPPARSKAMTFINKLRGSTTLYIVPASQALFAAGWTLYCQRPDKRWTLTDCTSFAIMAREQLTQAFTSDHHFEQAGFVKLLPFQKPG